MGLANLEVASQSRQDGRRLMANSCQPGYYMYPNIMTQSGISSFFEYLPRLKILNVKTQPQEPGSFQSPEAKGNWTRSWTYPLCSMQIKIYAMFLCLNVKTTEKGAPRKALQWMSFAIKCLTCGGAEWVEISLDEIISNIYCIIFCDRFPFRFDTLSSKAWEVAGNEDLPVFSSVHVPVYRGEKALLRWLARLKQ